MPEIDIDAQIACIKRELRLRQSAYPRFVARGTMLQRDADRELQAMQAVLATLERVRSEQRPELFR